MENEMTRWVYDWPVEPYHAVTIGRKYTYWTATRPCGHTHRLKRLSGQLPPVKAPRSCPICHALKLDEGWQRQKTLLFPPGGRGSALTK
jgi:hypothetical protein